MENVLNVYVYHTLDGFAQQAIKAALRQSYSIEEKDYEDQDNGFKFLFKFLFDSETGGRVKIEFFKVYSNLRIMISGDHAWEVADIYRLVECCFDQEESTTV